MCKKHGGGTPTGIIILMMIHRIFWSVLYNIVIEIFSLGTPISTLSNPKMLTNTRTEKRCVWTILRIAPLYFNTITCTIIPMTTVGLRKPNTTLMISLLQRLNTTILTLMTCFRKPSSTGRQKRNRGSIHLLLNSNTATAFSSRNESPVGPTEKSANSRGSFTTIMKTETALGFCSKPWWTAFMPTRTEPYTSMTKTIFAPMLMPNDGTIPHGC